MNKRRREKEEDIVFNIFVACFLSIFLIAFTLKFINDDTSFGKSNQYYKSAEVVEIQGNLTYFQDIEGQIWVYEFENLQLFSRYVLLMDDCGTANISDDIILSIE